MSSIGYHPNCREMDRQKYLILDSVIPSFSELVLVIYSKLRKRAMPKVNKPKCNNCDFYLPEGWGYRFYVMNEKGKRTPWFPRVFTVQNIWGRGLSPELVSQLTGFNSDCVCLDCCREFEADLGQLPGYQSYYTGYQWAEEVCIWVAKDKRECPYCKSKNVKTARELVGEICAQCKDRVPNEIFNKLCDKDVKRIKDSDLNPFTPSLMAGMILALLKDTNFEKQIQKTLGRKLNGKERFCLLVFHSFCYFRAIHVNVHIKSGLGANDLPCRFIIEKQLKVALLNGLIKLMPQMESGLNYEEQSVIFRALGEALYYKFEDIDERLCKHTLSQFDANTSMASAVFGDEESDIFFGLPLYKELRDTSYNLSEVFTDTFLIEEIES